MQCSKIKRLNMTGILLIILFLSEIIIGTITHSLTVISDAFHVFSDLMAVIITTIAIKGTYSTITNVNHTYGQKRAEIVGAFANCVILFTICATIILESIQRLIEPVQVQNPTLILIISFLSLSINIIGALLLYDVHQNSHHHEYIKNKSSTHLEEIIDEQTGQNFNSNASDNEFGLKLKQWDNYNTKIIDLFHMQTSIDSNLRETTYNISDSFSTLKCRKNNKYKWNISDTNLLFGDTNSIHSVKRIPFPSKDRSIVNLWNNYNTNHNETFLHDHNHTSKSMRSVFLHFVADILTSFCVMINGIFINFIFKDKNLWWQPYIDSLLSLTIVLIIALNTLPLTQECFYILMQYSPKSINIVELKQTLAKLDSITNIHEIHIWQIDDLRTIGTVHLRCNDISIADKMMKEVKDIFHKYNIHSITVQIEYDDKYTNECGCVTENCKSYQCCTY
ncbi:unnamed protein product [Didymodactylos carnosus]|uniref:Uncharacterized protein n=1 Tax=Didymodactylos carnosus TaxID=1234261 RepID=A0A814EHC0_9BILA|nr:unnamed protein product [Didymodactylos carnosus]CAF0971075.1 unnamed protein product [Didymodactylos carnosus]CAF3574959.1 unnamed protein product [Didymodactylos carnosus]CAF3744123.1 unnamed protein product [Didymodactylos carnosus]